MCTPRIAVRYPDGSQELCCRHAVEAGLTAVIGDDVIVRRIMGALDRAAAIGVPVLRQVAATTTDPTWGFDVDVIRDDRDLEPKEIEKWN